MKVLTKDFFMKNKFKLIIISVFVVLFFFVAFTVKELVFPSDEKDLYGKRLDGISTVMISNDEKSLIKQALIQSEFVESAEIRVQGRIIYYDIYVKADADYVKVQAIVEQSISDLDNDKKDYYDFGVFLLSKEESEGYPILGSKHRTTINMKWSSDK